MKTINNWMKKKEDRTLRRQETKRIEAIKYISCAT